MPLVVVHDNPKTKSVESDTTLSYTHSNLHVPKTVTNALFCSLISVMPPAIVR